MKGQEYADLLDSIEDVRERLKLIEKYAAEDRRAAIAELREVKRLVRDIEDQITAGTG